MQRKNCKNFCTKNLRSGQIKQMRHFMCQIVPTFRASDNSYKKMPLISLIWPLLKTFGQKFLKFPSLHVWKILDTTILFWNYLTFNWAGPWATTLLQGTFINDDARNLQSIFSPFFLILSSLSNVHIDYWFRFPKATQII